MQRLFYTNEKIDNRIFQWMLGFQPSYGWMLVDDTTKEVLIFLDGRYFEKEIGKKKLENIPKNTSSQKMCIGTHPSESERSIEKVLLDKKITTLVSPYVSQDDKIVLEKTMPYGVVQALRKSDLDVQWMFDKDDWQKNIRIKKTGNDITHIQKAISLTEDIRERIKVQSLDGSLLGKTELEVRGMIVERAYSLGLEGEAFDTIVATGVNTAIPHHQTGRDIIGPGPLLVDMGFRWEGWCSDFTRCVRIPSPPNPLPPLPQGTLSGSAIHLVPQGEEIRGEPNFQDTFLKEEFDKILEIVQEAHDVARDMVELGVALKDIALAARKVIEDTGYGDYFTHSLGHGVGLDVHEAPAVSIKSPDVIEQGMIFTIEPGIYLPGKFGVRWENIVIVE